MKSKSLLPTIFVFAAAALAWGGDEKLASELREKSLNGNVDVIVRYKAVPSDKHHQKVTNGKGALKHKFDLIENVPMRGFRWVTA